MICPEIRNNFLSLYTSAERGLLVKLGALFEEWDNVYQEYRKDKGELQNYEMIVPDGFYPNYLSQKPKILFIGRESYTIEGCNYVDLFIDHYLAGRTGCNNCRAINRDKFHKLLIQVAYGIIYGKDWNNTPYAGDICFEGKIFDKISFAFMNLSKLSNNLDGQNTTNTNWSLFDHSVNMSINCGKNFILDEIELLDPDLIITMNLERHRLTKVFGEMLEFEDNDWWKYKVNFSPKNKQCLLIDSWHFSSTKKDKEDIYDPILKNWQDFCAEKNIKS